VKFLTNLGLYLHIPFCKKKCAYCDFYSAVLNEEMLDSYLNALIREIKQWGGKINRPIDTIYLGGGTPSLLNGKIKPLIDAVKQSFNVMADAEITIEINPQNDIEAVLKNAKIAGVNRLSIGAQSGSDQELKALGRTHTANDTENAVRTAQNMGFSNISLDLMIGLPDSSPQKLKQNLDFLMGLNPQHISAYILKIEPYTLFYKTQENLNLPDEDEICEQYLFMCDYLEKHGYEHYEISNFAKKGNRSRHNLKYWKCEEYLGLGPSAHSFLDGKRFYYERDLKGYIQNPNPVFDGNGGDTQEQIMLSLRLKEGVCADLLPQNKLDLYLKNGFATLSQGKFALTNKGMLVSNQIISQLLEEI
jgi:oxygen-independent coproporphyrinogen-3 oxidase